MQLPAMYLSLTYLRAKESQARVVIYPSDHFVFPENGVHGLGPSGAVRT